MILLVIPNGKTGLGLRATRYELQDSGAIRWSAILNRPAPKSLVYASIANNDKTFSEKVDRYARRKSK